MARRKATSLPSGETPDRSEGIEPWPDTPPPPTPIRVEPPPAAPAAALVQQDEPQPRRKRQPNRKDPSTTARIPQALFDGINAVKAGTKDTHGQWFAKALLATHDEVRTHYADLRAAEADAPFAIPQRKARKPDGVPMAQYPLRLPGDVRMFLARLEEEVDAPSRSDLMETIVRLRLKQLGYDVP